MTDIEAVLRALGYEPRTIQDLADSLRLPRRTVERSIQQLIAEGNPIVVGSDGAKFTDNPAVIRAYEESLKARAREIFRRRAALRKTRRKLEAPRTLWDLAS